MLDIARKFLRTSPLPIPKAWQRNYCEPSVQLALKDCCKPGQVVFDVGANAGALTIIMAKIVGLSGTVCAFEASKRIVRYTRSNLKHFSNVLVFNRAVHSRSGKKLPMYLGTHWNDSIYQREWCDEKADFEVETIALDDFVTTSGLTPDLVKMDIEGAEFDALLGAEKLIRDKKPVFIVEMSPHDMHCHELLLKAGYFAVDLGTYRNIHSAADFGEGVCIANVIFLHPQHVPAHPYTTDIASEKIYDLESLRTVRLKPGRYVCQADFISPESHSDIVCGVDSRHGRIMYYHGTGPLIAGSYRNWPFHLRREDDVQPFVKFKNKATGFKWNGANILHFPQFGDHGRG